MTKIEFQAFAVAGGFEQVVILRPEGQRTFELWGHVPGYRGSERFETARGEFKEWLGLTTVYSEVRAMGYRGPILVEG